MKLRGNPDRPYLRNHLVVDRRQRAQCPWIGEIAKAIRSNHECERGILSQYGWAWSQWGPTSDFHQPEMLVLVSQGCWTRGTVPDETAGYWYGHVFFMARDRDGWWRGGDQRHWVSVLARCSMLSDEGSAWRVLCKYRHDAMSEPLLDPPDEKLPHYLRTHRDTCSFHETMEEAVDMTARKIRDFRRSPFREES